VRHEPSDVSAQGLVENSGNVGLDIDSGNVESFRFGAKQSLEMNNE
jgi:hypothetical protein